MGLAYLDGDDIVVKRTVDDLQKFWGWYQYAESLGSPILLHFRLSTVGENSVENCQPLRVDDDLVFAHNGTISGFHGTDDRSDTVIYRDDVLKNLPPRWWEYDAVLDLIEVDIGYGNKFVFLTSEGEFIILNKKAGVDIDGMWFSNQHHKRYNQRVTYGRYRDRKDNSSEGEDSSGDYSFMEDSEISNNACLIGSDVICYDCFGSDHYTDDLEVMSKEDAQGSYCSDCGQHVGENWEDVADRNRRDNE